MPSDVDLWSTKVVTATRDQLHRLIDKLPEDELGAARQYLEYLEASGGLPAVLAEAPEEEDPLTPAEAASLAEAEAQVAQGEIIPDTNIDAALARARQHQATRR